MQYLFYGRQVFVHWACGSLTWIHMVCIASRVCWNSMFWTYVFHGQPVGSDKNYSFCISTIIADIWTKFDLHIVKNTVILAGQVSREIMQRNLLKHVSFHAQDVKLIFICGTARVKWSNMFISQCMDNIFVIVAKCMPYYSFCMWLILNSVSIYGTALPNNAWSVWACRSSYCAICNFFKDTLLQI